MPLPNGRPLKNSQHRQGSSFYCLLIAWLKFRYGLLSIFQLILFVYGTQSPFSICPYKTFLVLDRNNGPYQIRSMILWGYVIDFSVFSCKSQLKIVGNVAFVKLKRNFSQAINWLMFLYGQLQSPRPSQCPPFDINNWSDCLYGKI